MDPPLVCEPWLADLRTKHSSVGEDCSKNNLPSIARNVKSHCLVFMFKMSVSHFKVYRICNINSKALIWCGVSSYCENYCWFTFVFGTWVIVPCLFQSFVLHLVIIASICNIKKLPICCTSSYFIWLVSEKHRLIGNRIITKSANSLTGSAREAMITGRRVWNISKLLHFIEMRLHKKKNLHCKNCDAHLPTFHIEIPFN